MILFLIMRGLENCLAEVALGQVLLKHDRFSGLPVAQSMSLTSLSPALVTELPFIYLKFTSS